jgi:hypothetical protein
MPKALLTVGTGKDGSYLFETNASSADGRRREART